MVIMILEIAKDISYNNGYNLPHCCFTLRSIFPCFYSRAYIFNNDPCYFNLLFAFFTWIIGFLIFVMNSLFRNSIYDDINKTCMFKFLTICIGFCLFICYQILFTCLITPFILIAFVYPKFFTYKLDFLRYLINWYLNKKLQLYYLNFNFVL
jgi:hypothetical protein